MNSTIKRRIDHDLEEPMIKKKLHSNDEDNASVISNSSETSSTKNIKHTDEFFNSPTKVMDPLINEEIHPALTATPKKKAKPLASYDEIVKKYGKDPNAFKDDYKKVKYSGIDYHINEPLLIRNEEDASNDFIGTLLKIVRQKKPENNKVMAFLEVQW
jgi:hypothetical protein